MLTLARESVGMTQTALAHGISASQGHVSKVENGLEDPGAEFLQAAARLLGVPFEFFERSEEILGGGVVDFYHKKRLTLPAKPLRKANALANKCRLEATRLLRTLEFSEVAPFPTLSIEEHESVEEIATLVRATWRIPAGPLPNLVALAEAAGLPVFLVSLGHEKLFAISMPRDDGRHIIVLNRDLPASAQRYALAHEIGHLVMHANGITEDMEREADMFAAALLLPKEDSIQDLRSLRFAGLGPLKRKWHTSMAALIRRAYSLNTINESQYRSFNIQLNNFPGGRKREPGEFDVEEPRLLRHVINHYRSQLGYTKSDLEKLMVVTADYLNEFYLGEKVRSVRDISPERRLHSVPMADGFAQ